MSERPPCSLQEVHEEKETLGFVQDFKIYECEECGDCPLKALCTKEKGNRHGDLKRCNGS
ncbi:transposase [Rummeliibacillus sp. TYF-LIM-RU47]|uniref:transposase n=1 Tax=unclassified Rummeliibacillus TaxID=2622809 RepID=UPI001CC26F20